MTQSQEKRQLELLAPAGNADIAIEAILHGADAVYMGASSHGARSKAANSIEDIKRVIDFAHIFRVKVYVTVNTIVYEQEISKVEHLINNLYRIGVDAIIVQDMGILRMDLPPIPLHASTQCDIRTPEKARFLQDVGFSQLVLPRELTLEEIKKMREAISIPLESFVHGALCVCYSGRCHASFASCGRSANRGECAQICRLPFTLSDANGRIICKDKHLLSLRDLNTIDILPKLIDAGVSSFKIEGRLKETSYVKNTVTAYRKVLDSFISANPEDFRRSSCGASEVTFLPELSKSFNRGFSHYFIDSRRPIGIISPDTPKSLGEPIIDVAQLNSGDGISFFDAQGKYTGAMVNGVKGQRIVTSKPVNIPKGAKIQRTFDRIWEKEMQRHTATRKIGVDFTLDDSGLFAVDERGCYVRIPLDCNRDVAKKTPDYTHIFSKLGNTSYLLRSFRSNLDPTVFIPAADLTELRRRAIDALDEANNVSYPFQYRKKENPDTLYMTDNIDYRDNVANTLSEKFYRDHGVKKIERALEVSKPKSGNKGLRVMTTRHCILRELGMCKKEKGVRHYAEPLSLKSGKETFTLEFNCRDCEMHLLD